MTETETLEGVSYPDIEPKDTIYVPAGTELDAGAAPHDAPFTNTSPLTGVVETERVPVEGGVTSVVN